MNSPIHPPDETISRYLDGALTPDEQADFAARLAQDPEAALTFARMARTDALLAAAFPARPRRRPGKPIIWLAAAAALAAGCFVAVRHLGGESPAPPVIALPSPDKTPPPAATGRRRTVKPAPAAAAATLTELFARYAVTADPQGLTVPEALAALEANIRELNLLGRPELNSLRFFAGASRIPGNASPVIASPVHGALTIRSYLDICACYAAVTWRSDGKFAAGHDFVREIHGSPDALRTYRVPPDFLAAWHFRHPQDDPGGDPFTAPHPDDRPPMEELARDYFGLRTAAADGERSARLHYLPDAGTLEVHGATLEEYDHVARLLEVSQRPEARRNYFITLQLVTGDIGAALPGADGEKGIVLDEAAFGETQRVLARTAGVNVLTAPNLMMRPGQRGEIQTIDEVSVPDGKDQVTFDCVGLSVPLEVIPWGEFICVRGTVDIGTQTPDTNVRHDVTGFDLWLPSGATAGFTLEHTGSPAAAFITVQEIDPSGQPLK